MGRWDFVPNFFVETVAKIDAAVRESTQLSVETLFALVCDSGKQI